eukprot:EG_transcript_803
MQDSFLTTSPTGPRRLASLNRSLDKPAFPAAEFKRPLYESPGTPNSNAFMDDLDDEISHELQQFRTGKKWQYGVTDYKSKASRFGLVVEASPPAMGHASNDLSASSKGAATALGPLGRSPQRALELAPTRLSPLRKDLVTSPISPLKETLSPLRTPAAAKPVALRDNAQHHVLLLTNYYEALAPDVHRKSFRNVEKHFEALFHDDVRVNSAKRTYNKNEWRAVLADMVSNNVHARDFIVRRYEGDHVVYCLTLLVGTTVSYPRSKATFLNGQCIKIEPSAPMEGQNYEDHKTAIQSFYGTLTPALHFNRVQRFLSVLDDLLHDGFAAHIAIGKRNKAEWRAQWEDLVTAGVMAQDPTVHYSEGHVCGYSVTLTVNGTSVVLHDRVTFREDQILRLDAVLPGAMQQLVAASLNVNKAPKSNRGPAAAVATAGSRPRLSERLSPVGDAPSQEILAIEDKRSPVYQAPTPTYVPETRKTAAPAPAPTPAPAPAPKVQHRASLVAVPRGNAMEALFLASAGRMTGLAALKESQKVVVGEVPSGSSQSFLGGTRAPQAPLPLHKDFAPKAAPAPTASTLRTGDGLATLLASGSSHLKGLLSPTAKGATAVAAASPPRVAVRNDGVPMLLKAASLTGSSRFGLLKLQAAAQPADPRHSPTAAAAKAGGGAPRYSALPAVSPAPPPSVAAPAMGPFHGLAGLMQVVPPGAMLGYLSKLARVAHVPQTPATEFSGLSSLLQIAADKRLTLPATEGVAHAVGVPVPPKSETEFAGLDLLLGVVLRSPLPYNNLRCLGAASGRDIRPLEGPPAGTAMAALLIAADHSVHQLGGLQLLTAVNSTGMSALRQAAQRTGPSASVGLQMVTTVLQGGKLQAPSAAKADKKPSGPVTVSSHVITTGYLSWQSGKPESPVLAQRKGMIDIAPHVKFVGYLRL